MSKLFYQNLYSSKESEIEDVDLSNVLNDDTPKLTEQEAESLEGYITLKEAGEALSKMNNNKSPGSSGFTVEFFKFFLVRFRKISCEIFKLQFRSSRVIHNTKRRYNNMYSKTK